MRLISTCCYIHAMSLIELHNSTKCEGQDHFYVLEEEII